MYPIHVNMAHGIDTDELPMRLKSIQDGVLDLSGLRITSLPDLPMGITTLNCWNTDITYIPYLPNLIKLYCGNTKITSIPYLPNLRVLYCSNTNITSIPSMPNLISLMCDNTLMTSLPNLPRIGIISCEQCTLMDDYEWVYIQDRYQRSAHIQWYIHQTQINLQESRDRSTQRYRDIKEDLMAAAWHPSRVESWLNHGEAVFNMMTGYA